MSGTVLQEIRSVVCDAKSRLGRTQMMKILATYSSVGELTFGADYNFAVETRVGNLQPCTMCPSASSLHLSLQVQIRERTSVKEEKEERSI